MKEKRNCRIVQDLLPNYLEKLTNEESNQFIKEHLKECKECNKVLENMKREIKIEGEKREKREINFFKRYNRKLKILGTILLFIVMIFVILTARKIFIIADLQHKSLAYLDSDNFYMRIYYHSGSSFNIGETYRLGNRTLTRYTHLDKDKTTEMVISYDGKKTKNFITNGEIKVIDERESNLNPVMISPHIYASNTWELMFLAVTSSIKSVRCNDQDCYLINLYGVTEYINKETGLTVKSLNGISKTQDGTYDIVADYYFEFGKVTEEDLKEPDSREYKKIEEYQ